MKEYIELKAAIRAVQRYGVGALDADDFSPEQAERFIISKLSTIPAADVVEVRKIRAFIDKLIAERDKYDLHSMRWEHYDCDRLLIEQMLDEMDGGVNDAAD